MSTSYTVRWTCSSTELPSLPFDVEHILRSAALLEVSDCSKDPTQSKKEATFTGAWEIILNACKINHANCNRQGVEEPLVEPGPGPECEDDAIATAMQEVFEDEVKSQADALATIP